jgi:hypothetical protein
MVIIFGKKPMRGGCPPSLNRIMVIERIVGLLYIAGLEGVSWFIFVLFRKKIKEEEIIT